MKKRAFLALFAAFLLMTVSGCSSGGGVCDEWKSLASGEEKMTVTAEITAGYGDMCRSFTLRYDDGEGKIFVLAPDEIAGISAAVSRDGKLALEYDGAILDIGEVGDGISPIGVLPLIVGAWSCGWTENVGFEVMSGIPCAVVSSPVSDEITVTTWIEKESSLPIYSEVAYMGAVVVQCIIRNVSFK